MKLFILLFGLFSPISNFAQSQKVKQEKGFAVIKGNIKNYTEEFFDFMQPNYFSNPVFSVPVERDGSFIKKIEFDGNIQDLYLSLNGSPIAIYVEKQDTIDITWDATNFDNTFRINSNNNKRHQTLQTQLNLYKLYWKEYMKLANLGREKISDSAKFNIINDLFNKEIITLCDNRGKYATVPGFIKIATDIYYRYTLVLMGYKLFPTYELFVINTSEKIIQHSILKDKKEYKILSGTAFKISPEYRNFLFAYMRFYNNPFNGYDIFYFPNEKKDKSSAITPVWDDYYKGLANLKNYEIRDWFIASIIINGFKRHSFDEVSAVYKDFLSKIKIQAFGDTLKKFYTNMLRLKPGNIAPGFTLKDENGKMVPLKNFRGKVVYINFWGVSCGPCITQIKNYFPHLHERYKDKNVVFLNICADSNEQKWKESLLKLNLTGTNLIAEEWLKNPVLKTYGITSLPHYMILDAEGKMVDNNANSPSQTITLYKKLDKLLEK